MSRFEQEPLQFIDRSETDSRKWSGYTKSEALPMGMADMDVRTPQVVLDALKKRIDQGIFGYDNVRESLFTTVIDRLKNRYNWDVEREAIILSPGIIPSMYAAGGCVDTKGTNAIAITPAYSEIMESIKHSGMEMLTVESEENNGDWSTDAGKVESVITEKTRLLTLCNPHNPTGHVYTLNELKGLASVCKRHQITISSDEVYADLILDGKNQHIPIASIDQEIAQQTITHMSASKTFNLSGLRFSYTIIQNKQLRDKFISITSRIQQGVNFLGAIATEAAYKDGEGWRLTLLDHLRSNRELIYQHLRGTKNLSASKIQATFLAWINAKPLKINDLQTYFKEKVGIEILDGRLFNAPGYIRLNFGCSKEMLDLALERIGKII